MGFYGNPHLYVCVCSSHRAMASRRCSLLILALPGPSHGSTCQRRSTPLKVMSNLYFSWLYSPFSSCTFTLAISGHAIFLLLLNPFFNKSKFYLIRDPLYIAVSISPYPNLKTDQIQQIGLIKLNYTEGQTVK